MLINIGPSAGKAGLTVKTSLFTDLRLLTVSSLTLSRLRLEQITLLEFSQPPLLHTVHETYRGESDEAACVGAKLSN